MVSRSASFLLLFCFGLARSANLRAGEGQDGDQNLDNCECVPYFQCDEDRRIKTGGEGLLDVRIPTCPNTLDVCCLPPDDGVKSPPSKGPGGEPEQPPEGPEQPPEGPEQPPEGPEQPPEGPEQPPEGTKQPPVIQRPPFPQGTGCGLRRNVQDLDLGDAYRITGPQGAPSPTGFGEFPWMVAIFKVDGGANKFICGGSLIKPSVVLTAAHCLVDAQGGTIKVRAGDWDTQVKAEPIPHQDRSVSRLIPHPDFNQDNLRNDIALIILESPFEIHESVDTVCYPGPQDTDIDPNNCLATGWGKNDFSAEGKYQTVLRKVQVPIVPNQECQERLRKTRLGKHFRLHNSFICAGGVPQQDTCTGDGGGPLFCPMEPGRYTQVGIVSWGIGCGNENPAVYANVQYFSEWISSHLNSL